MLITLLSLNPLLSFSQADSIHEHYEIFLLHFLNGIKEYDQVPGMVETAKRLKQDEVANLLSDDYICNYLLKDDTMHLFTKSNLAFIRNNTKYSSAKGFTFFYQNTDRIDSTMGMIGYSMEFLKYIITKEDVDPVVARAIQKKEIPDWLSIQNYLGRKYSDNYSVAVLLDSRIRWTSYKKQWTEYCKLVIQKVKKLGPFCPFPSSTDYAFNWNAWDLFQRSDNKEQLQIALNWSASAIRLSGNLNAEYLDTHANILYKLGKVKKAIQLERRAMLLDPNAKDIHENLDKMIAGKPTWPDPE